MLGKTSEGEPPSEGAILTGAVGVAVSPTGKKSSNTRDVKVAGAPGSAAGKGSPVPAQSRAHVTLYYHSRDTYQVE